MSAAIPRDDVLRHGRHGDERRLKLIDGTGLVHAVEFLVEEARPIHVGGDRDVGLVTAPRDNRRQHAVHACVFELACDVWGTGDLYDLSPHLHPHRLAIVEVAPGVASIGADLVAVDNIGIAGRHGPGDVFVVGLP